MKGEKWKRKHDTSYVFWVTGNTFCQGVVHDLELYSERLQIIINLI